MRTRDASSNRQRETESHPPVACYSEKGRLFAVHALAEMITIVQVTQFGRAAIMSSVSPRTLLPLIIAASGFPPRISIETPARACYRLGLPSSRLLPPSPLYPDCPYRCDVYFNCVIHSNAP